MYGSDMLKRVEPVLIFRKCTIVVREVQTYILSVLCRKCILEKKYVSSGDEYNHGTNEGSQYLPSSF